MAGYPFTEIEKKWQEHWENNKTFSTPQKPDHSKSKFYVLDMYPYPSGAGLHVGHPEGYTATDIIARFKRMSGFNVMHPMGWDAFGLPAEQYAIQTGTHPRITTEQNIKRFRQQLKALGFSYDWDREIDSTDPKYVRWTQWIFLKLYEKGLAYQAEVPVWCLLTFACWYPVALTSCWTVISPFVFRWFRSSNLTGSPSNLKRLAARSIII